MTREGGGREPKRGFRVAEFSARQGIMRVESTDHRETDRIAECAKNLGEIEIRGGFAAA